jgi:hypothetical protein
MTNEEKKGPGRKGNEREENKCSALACDLCIYVAI